jgi:STE24 endopeptidase
VIQRRYRLSTQTWPMWTVDLLKAYALSAVIGGAVMLGSYAAGRARRCQRCWRGGR